MRALLTRLRQGFAMADAQTPLRADIEYRFNYDIASHTCPLCGTTFESRPGSWPYLAGTHTPVCAGNGCPVGDDVTAGPSPCDTVFQFIPLESATIEAIAAAESLADSVAERLRHVALDESLPDPDRAVLQLAAIDLQFCEADSTRIVRVGPVLTVVTCCEAAAEMLLSGCGEIVSANGAADSESPHSVAS